MACRQRESQVYHAVTPIAAGGSESHNEEASKQEATEESREEEAATTGNQDMSKPELFIDHHAAGLLNAPSEQQTETLNKIVQMLDQQQKQIIQMQMQHGMLLQLLRPAEMPPSDRTLDVPGVQLCGLDACFDRPCRPQHTPARLCQVLP